MFEKSLIVLSICVFCICSSQVLYTPEVVSSPYYYPSASPSLSSFPYPYSYPISDYPTAYYGWGSNKENTGMILFQGKVNLINNCVNKYLKNSTSCTIKCGYSSDCFLAFMNETTCFHCSYGNLSSFSRVTNNYYIAMKMTSLSTLINTNSMQSFEMRGTCPYGTYNLKQCDNGWKMFVRDEKWICLKVFDNGTPLVQSEAKRLCSKASSILSGPDSEEERLFVYEQARERYNNGEKTGVWLDGARKSNCENLNTLYTAPCNGTKGFIFDDETLTQKKGYLWNEGEPNGQKETPVQECIFMMITKRKSKSGKIDDIGCEDLIEYLIKGALCRRFAK